MSNLSSLFQSLGIDQSCIINPDSCIVSYIETTENSSCCESNCSPAEIKSINLVDLLSSIAHIDPREKDCVFCEKENPTGQYFIFEGSICPSGYHFKAPHDHTSCYSVDYNDCVNIFGINGCLVDNDEYGESAVSCYLLYNVNNGFNVVTFDDIPGLIYRFSPYNPFGSYIDDGSAPSLSNQNPGIKFTSNDLKDLLIQSGVTVITI